MASASAVLFWRSAAISVVEVAKSPTPVASPSTPSMRLMALVQATSQRTVTGKFHQALLPLSAPYPAKPWM